MAGSARESAPYEFESCGDNFGLAPRLVIEYVPALGVVLRIPVKTTSAEYDRGVALGLNGVRYTWKENDDDIIFTKSHGLIFCFPSLDEMTHVALLDTGGYQLHEGLPSLTVEEICANFSDWVEKAIALLMIDTTHSCLFCHTLIDNTTHAACDACVDKALKVYLESPQGHEAIMRRKTEPTILNHCTQVVRRVTRT
jgi:hypothetical protein